MTFKKFDIRCQKSNSSNETPNVMTVGVENYGLSLEKCIMDQSCPVVHKSRRPQSHCFTYIVVAYKKCSVQ
jgi:hypothetical protein